MAVEMESMANPSVDFVCKTTKTCQTPTSSSQPTCFSNKKLDNDASGLCCRLKYTQDMRPLYQKCIVGKWLDKLPSLLQMVQSAFIEDRNEQRTRTQDDSEQHDKFDYISEVPPPGFCNDIDNGLKFSSRIELEMGAEVKRNKDRVNRSFASSVSLNVRQIYLSGVLIQNDETGLDGDVVEDSELDALGERHTQGWKKNQDDLISVYQSDSTVSSIHTDAIEYKQMCLESLDNRILLELQHMGLSPEAVPDLALAKDDKVMEELCKLQIELQQQVSKNKAQKKSLEKAVLRKLQFEDRERERLAMNKLLERAFNRHIGCRSTNTYAKSSGRKVAKQAALAFAKRTVERCRDFDATGRSCFIEATLKEKLFCINSKETDLKSTGDTTECKILPENANPGGISAPLDIKSLGAVLECPCADVSILASENSGHLVPQPIQKKHMKSNEPSDSCQAATFPFEQTGGKDESGSIQTKKKEKLLENVVGSSGQRNSSVLRSSLVGGRKGHCSEREREKKGKNKDTIARMNNAKSSQHSLGNVKGERKTKKKTQQRTKKKTQQRMGQLSKEVTGLLNKSTEAKNKCSSNFNENARNKSIKAKDDSKMGTNPGISQHSQCEINRAIDLSHLQLSGMEEFERNGDLGDGGYDLGSLLNFEEDILEDAAGDYVGLEVPMDDLFDLELSDEKFF